jgi:flagellar hook-length control protein FliK
MKASIQVAHPEARAAVEANLPQLRQALANQGIDVHRIDVFAPGESLMKESARQHQTQVRQRSRRRPAADTPGVEAADKYVSGKRLGYNTIELIM